VLLVANIPLLFPSYKEDMPMSNYSGHLLCSGTGANADFISVPITIRPGVAFRYQQDPDRNILLAGGFPVIHPDSSFPLSPTLQLNGDLTDMDGTQITALAKAEFTRHNSQSYRSYTLEPDSRVAVLGPDAASLHAFINTYGGVLQIDPILVKGYDPELTTAQELQINRFKKSSRFQINFTVKHPIDLNLCTYCRACGAACPEKCLSEQLFLDFSHCSYCKECLAACPHEAIDLYGVERRELITPAILILEGTKVDLPEQKTKQKQKIYSEATLPALFEAIYATEVDEVISWDTSLCQYSARLKTGCTACVEACHHAAINQDMNGVQIDHLACIECGACLSSCPTGALQYKRFDDIHFVEYFRTFPLSPGTTVILGDEQALHKHWWHNSRQDQKNLFFMEYPQPAALHAMHFLLLYAMGAKQIFVLGNENSRATLQMQFINTLLQELFQQEQAVRLIPTDTLTNVLEEDESTAILSNFYHDFSYSNRREKVIDLIEFLKLQSNTETVLIADIATEDFGEILCDEEKCTQCIACVNECRTGALTADSENYSLKHTPALCVQCGICITVCPENALSAQNGLSLKDDFFKERIVAQAEPARCKGCGKIFGTRKSLEKVVAILSAKNMWDKEDDLLSYCDSCRVVNLYESIEK
jgi:ferredoxin